MVKNGFGFWLLLFPLQLLAQSFAPNPDWRFESFNSQNHFVGGEIHSIAMDKYGYLWTCSRGVQRFDGYHTEDYDSFSTGNNAIRSNSVNILADSYGRIWAGSGGLCYYDYALNKFVYLTADAAHNFKTVNSLLVYQNRLWFVCEYGLAYVDLRTLKVHFTRLTFNENPLTNYVYNDSTLLIGFRDKAFLYNIHTGNSTRHNLEYKHSLLYITGLTRYRDGFLLATATGLFRFNNIDSISLLSPRFKDMVIEGMLFLPQDKEKKFLFVATDGQGILVYNVVTGAIVANFVHDENNIYSLLSNVIIRLYADPAGRLWIGTASGMNMLDLKNQQQKMRFFDRNSDFYINEITRDKFDTAKVWMSSLSRGIVRINWPAKRVEKTYDAPGLRGLHDAVQVTRDTWLLLSRRNILEWNSRTGSLFKTDPPVPSSFRPIYSLSKIIPGMEGNYFITCTHGLFKYNISTHKATLLASCKPGDPATDQWKYYLTAGFYNNGVVWAAAKNGLFRYDIKKNATTIYRGQGADADYYFYDLTKTADGRIICGSHTGFVVFDTTKKSFRLVNKIANLVQPTCVSVASIGNNVWLGTEVGILTYNLVTNKSSKTEFQTPLMQVFPSSSFALIGNDITVGYRNGFGYITPAANAADFPSAPIIESVLVNNQPADARALVLDHEKNAVGINFTSFLYSSPDDIRFRYRLDGAESHWQYPIGQRSANYEQLPPGKYSFYVQSGSKDGKWNPQTAAVAFEILPPFWRTGWFTALVVLTIAGILYSIYLYRLRHRQAIEKLRETIASDFHDDMGSTLSSISIFSEVAMQKADTDVTTTKNLVGDIGSRARAMMYAMNDMIWMIKPQNDNLYLLMERMEEFAQPIAEAREIDIDFYMDESMQTLTIDMLRRKALFLIFKEAVNNALKYSGASKIEVRFSVVSKKTMSMQVNDDGKGFDINVIKKGNGLDNMHTRATEINGKLKINSHPGAGTEISVFFKIA